MITRAFELRRYSILVMGLWMCIAVSQSVIAAAPMVGTQAPGFYRMRLGDFEVTALNDGVVDYLTARVIPTATPQMIKDGLFKDGVTDPVGMSYNAFLINTGNKLILIDTGSGESSRTSRSSRAPGV